jgi:hypothetical protein
MNQITPMRRQRTWDIIEANPTPGGIIANKLPLLFFAIFAAVLPISFISKALI